MEYVTKQTSEQKCSFQMKDTASQNAARSCDVLSKYRAVIQTPEVLSVHFLDTEPKLEKELTTKDK